MTEPTIEEMRAAWEARENKRERAREYSRRPDQQEKRREYSREHYREILRLAKLAREAGLG